MSGGTIFVIVLLAVVVAVVLLWLF